MYHGCIGQRGMQEVYAEFDLDGNGVLSYEV